MCTGTLAARRPSQRFAINEADLAKKKRRAAEEAAAREKAAEEKAAEEAEAKKKAKKKIKVGRAA